MGPIWNIHGLLYGPQYGLPISNLAKNDRGKKKGFMLLEIIMCGASAIPGVLRWLMCIKYLATLKKR